MSRYIALFALVALAAAYPAGDDIPRPITSITDPDLDDPSPWFRFPPFGNIFAPLTKLFSNFADIGPKIIVDDDKFEVIVNVKDYKKDDLKVKVKGDFILVQGAHEAKHDDHDLFASQFFHTYTLPLNASASDVTAVLTSDGYLDVTAPINGAVDDTNKIVEREVPIVESGKPLKEEKEQVEPSPTVPLETVDTLPNVDKVENFDKVESLDTPVEPLAKVESVDKVEAVDTPVEPLSKTETVDTVEPVNTTEEPLAKVEAIDKVEPAVEQVKVEEPVPTVGENVDEVETVDKSDSGDKIENVNKVEDVEPTAALDNDESVDKVEVIPVTTEAADEAEVEKKEAPTTPASERQEVTVPAEQDSNAPLDNEVNEIQP